MPPNHTQQEASVPDNQDSSQHAKLILHQEGRVLVAALHHVGPAPRNGQPPTWTGHLVAVADVAAKAWGATQVSDSAPRAGETGPRRYRLSEDDSDWMEL